MRGRLEEKCELVCELGPEAVCSMLLTVEELSQVASKGRVTGHHSDEATGRTEAPPDGGHDPRPCSGSTPALTKHAVLTKF